MNLMRQTRKHSGKENGLFFFTSTGQADSRDVLMDDIWLQVGREAPISLFK
jgi:hypothetical protein